MSGIISGMMNLDHLPATELLSLDAVAQSLNTQTLNAKLFGEDIFFNRISIDSRSIKSGELYLAIRGENFDGHDFIQEAFGKGAIACVVEEQQHELKDVSQLVVKDSKLALAKIATLWADKWKQNKKVIAITGSCGKTTVKEMVASIAMQLYLDKTDGKDKVLLTQGNLNNDFGVPLTLMRLRKKHQLAVVEMGANHLQEIAYLSAIVRPDIAIVTNAGNAHIEGFGSLEGVAKGKGEIFSALSDQGLAIINNDDDFADYWKSLVAEKSVRTMTFGLEKTSDISVVNANINRVEDGMNLWQIKIADEQFVIELPIPGKHNLLNALAAIAVGKAIGASTEQIQRGLQHFKNASGRLEFNQQQHNFTLINDTYNANPDSVKAAIDVLCDYTHKRKILILGDMGELGEEAKQLHQMIGEYAANSGINDIYTLGALSQHTQQQFEQIRRAKLNKKDMPVTDRVFNDISLLNQQLINDLQEEQVLKDSVVLVKGSRKMAMEGVVKALEEIS